MSFVSISFIIFVIIIAVAYYILPKKFQTFILLLGSILFYAVFSIRALGILLFSTILTFLCAKAFGSCREIQRRRCILIMVVGINILLLIVLKYFNFWTRRFELVIPLGISFYTLSLVGYLIDIYRKKYDPEKNFLTFLLYVSYFPHILQGPIARYDQLGPQLRAKHYFDYQKVCEGGQLIIWGYIQKMIIADRAAIFVNAVYQQYATVSGTILFIASLLYTIQIYADFSGCVNIAMGVSEIFDINLIQNFRQPYLAVSINDFWKRWHISLSSWFRDYLYIPLGGNRKGVIMRWLNVLIVFTVSGFWHGVGLNYIVWGLLHGMYQVIGYILMPLRRWATKKLAMDKRITELKLVHIMGTFLLVNFAWIFFRVTDLSAALSIIKAIIIDFAPWTLIDGTLYTFGLSERSFHLLLVFTVIMFAVDVMHNQKIALRRKIEGYCLPVRWLVYIGAVFAILVFGIYGIGYDASSFIYMNF